MCIVSLDSSEIGGTEMTFEQPEVEKGTVVVRLKKKMWWFGREEEYVVEGEKGAVVDILLGIEEEEE